MLFIVCPLVYCTAFVVVHRSPTMRRPAFNMHYWYYSDQNVIEAMGFYGFWAPRQVAYIFFPDFMTEHVRERNTSDTFYPPGFDDEN
jgi:hypothetical protein